MNRYKMISICSLSIVCVLILSLLMPLTIDANDKESLEIKMHYAKSTVTTNIIVNSDIYTGVVCKYIELDDVLTEEDLPAKTQSEGATVNLNQTSKDNYEAIIENVSKRYVVIYVSIGNCELCDYIDCNPSAAREEQNSEADTNDNAGQNNDSQKGLENTDNIQDTSTTKSTPDSNETPSSTLEDKNTEETNNLLDNNQRNTTSEEIPTSNQPVEVPENTQNNNSDNTENQPVVTNNDNQEPAQTNNSNQTQEATQPIVENTNSGSGNFETIQESQNDYIPEVAGGSQPIDDNTPVQYDGTNTGLSNTDTYNEIQTQNTTSTTTTGVSKDTMDFNGFQEIQPVEKTSVADSKMPQTGENDSIKIMGIVLFSIIAVVSFYKYKKEK